MATSSYYSISDPCARAGHSASGHLSRALNALSCPDFYRPAAALRPRRRLVPVVQGRAARAHV